MIEIQNLGLKRNGHILLNRIDLSIPSGEYAALIGANGAGKTSLIRCMIRLIDDWSGSILINGRSNRDLARKIAYVQQVSDTVPFSVWEFVAMSRYPHLALFDSLTQEDRDIVNTALQETGIINLSDRPMENLSGGERQKVFLAAATVQQTDILLLDEPATFLDYRRQMEIASLLQSINQKKGTTVVEITHDINHAADTASRIIALGEGSVLYDGDPSGLMNPDLLQRIFSVDFKLVEDPDRKFPLIIPNSKKYF
ncbi:MAG: ABC transporter ATP-binding protein [Planctomycetia bacterium]|nr:ABC transporter ATP-binding protein [Planctomycetia bacterium]